MKRLLGTLFALLLLGACGDDKTSDGGGTPLPKPAGKYATVNKWMYSYMSQNYLWPDPLTTMKTDYSLDYQKFLQSLLDGVAAHTDAQGRPLNYDDGHWSGDQREYYYSYVDGPKPASRSAGDEVTETGLWLLQPVRISEAQIVFFIETVTPDSPASRAGLRRGDFITEVDGLMITDPTVKTLLDKCYYGPSVRLLPNRIVSGKVETLTEVTLSAETFTDPAIYRSTVVTVGDKRVGYLLYMGFESSYDEELISAFRMFRDNDIDELVVDLRYNGGGAVRSSTLLATLILGDAYKGETYCRMIYNATRMAALGQPGFYRIGDKSVPDGNGTYQPIADALSQALGLKRIYVICSGKTASASELLVNGLRGFDLEVRLVGTRTNGKNVGMEGSVDREIGGEKYTFMPITFYSENAKGFRDYSDGFEPDVTVADPAGYYLLPGDFATQDDDCFRMVSEWIETGVQPVFQTRVSRASVTPPLVARPLPDATVRPNRHSQGSLVFRE
ncbi:MAG: hypothetical protein K2L06_06200 [Alistipes sp.]|nr:hypothetical protein [Alistipes sp.]